MAKSKKEQRLLEYLLAYKSITSMEAIIELGDTRLAETIFEMKKHGYRFETTRETYNNRFGEKCSVARYRLIEEER